MKNNLKALVVHLLITVITFIFLLIFVATGPKIGKYTTHIISRILILVGILLSYVLGGLLLDTSTNKNYDFLVESFIGLLGLLLWLYTMSLVGWNLFTISKELSDFWVLINIYQTPFTFISFLFSLPNTPIISFLTNFLPGLLMGLGLRYKRYKNMKRGGEFKWN